MLACGFANENLNMMIDMFIFSELIRPCAKSASTASARWWSSPTWVHLPRPPASSTWRRPPSACTWLNWRREWGPVAYPHPWSGAAHGHRRNTAATCPPPAGGRRPGAGRSTPAGRGLTGRVRLGASTGAIAHLLPQALARLRMEHPGIDVQVQVLTSQASLTRLREGTLDIGLVALPQVAGKGLMVTPGGATRFLPMCRPTGSHRPGSRRAGWRSGH